MTENNEMEEFLVEKICNIDISLKSVQECALKQLLNRKDVPVVLPVGFGKGLYLPGLCKAEDG